MYIENDIIPRSKRSLFYTKRTPGVIVIDNEESKNQNLVGVYIPRLMFGIDASGGPREQTINLKNNFILNSENKNIGSNKVKVRNYVLLPFFIIPNISVPVFKKGENVIVDFADNDIKSMFIMPYKLNEMDVRKTDTASFYVPAKEKEDDEVKLENIYALQLDSESKNITLIMNNANSEVSRYFIQMNGEEGFVQISDDNKRFIKISTETDEIMIQNESQAFISLKERILEISCDDIIVNAENQINLVTETLSTQAETITEKSSTKDSNVDNYTMNGSALEIKYTTIKKDGSNEKNSFSGKVTVDTPIMGVSGLLTTGGLGFEPPTLGQKPLPTSSFIDKTGLANFNKPSPTGMPLAIGAIVTNALKSLAAAIDAVCGIHGIPPMQSQIISTLSSQINSKRVKG